MVEYTNKACHALLFGGREVCGQSSHLASIVCEHCYVVQVEDTAGAKWRNKYGAGISSARADAAARRYTHVTRLRLEFLWR